MKALMLAVTLWWQTLFERDDDGPFPPGAPATP